MTASRMGPYGIGRRLGAGGMGEVYRARDTRLGHEVALKILPADFARDATRCARFVLEARAASALNHPNIVTVHDLGEEGGVAYIVTELIEGESLRAPRSSRAGRNLAFSLNRGGCLTDIDLHSLSVLAAQTGRYGVSNESGSRPFAIDPAADRSSSPCWSPDGNGSPISVPRT